MQTMISFDDGQIEWNLFDNGEIKAIDKTTKVESWTTVEEIERLAEIARKRQKDMLRLKQEIRNNSRI